MIRGPRLLVPWESRWQGFRSALKPALSRSKPRWDGECSLEHRGTKSTFSSLLLHACILVWIVRMGALPASYSHDVEPAFPENATIVYYSGAFPTIQDASGAREGGAWSRGGRALHREGQKIKISAPSESEIVAQVDHLNLPRRISSPANFVAVAESEAPSISTPKQPQIRPAEIQAPIAPAPEPMSSSLRQMQTPDLHAQVVPPPVEVPFSKSTDLARLTIPSDLTPLVLPPVPRRKMSTAVPPSEVAPADVKNSAAPSALRDLLRASSAPGVVLGQPDQVTSPLPAAAHQIPDGTVAIGYVISSDVGRDVGLPERTNLGGGSFSPNGISHSGSGRNGGGTGASSGDGTGAAMNHVPGPGGAMNGRDQGARPSGKGNSLDPGKGGSGNGSVQNAGISISGNTIQIGSFAATLPSIDPMTQKPLGPRKQPGITIVGTPRSGGAINRYGALPGSKVYTIYLDTPAGLATLEYASSSGQGQNFAEELTAPEPLTTDLPQNLKGTTFVLRCKMDRDGVMHGFQVLDAIEKNLTPALIAALENWRFRPVLQNGESVEVDAIIGLNVRTH